MGLPVKFEPFNVGLKIDPSTTYDEWSEKGKELATLIGVYNRNLQWWLGDWIIFGEDRFPSKYSQALEISMYNIGTLRNVVYVCRNVPPGNRNPRLSFNHHAAVAKVPKERQKKLLKSAEERCLSVRDFRMLVEGNGPRIGETDVMRLNQAAAEFLENELDTVLSMWADNIGDAIRYVFGKGYSKGAQR